MWAVCLGVRREDSKNDWVLDIFKDGFYSISLWINSRKRE